MSSLIQNDRERRTTFQASEDWRVARGGDALPCLANLGIGDTAIEWRDRFLIHSSSGMDQAVFVACGETLQSDWGVARMGAAVGESIPDDLCAQFMEGCLRSVENGCPVPIDGSYQADESGEIIFRCVVMPVRGSEEKINFIYGAYSQKTAA